MGTPVAVKTMGAPGDYYLSVPAGSYYITAFLDWNWDNQLSKDSWGKINEPYGVTPSTVTVAAEGRETGVDIVLRDPGQMGTYAITGTVEYSGSQTGEVIVAVFEGMLLFSGGPLVPCSEQSLIGFHRLMS